MLSIGAFSKLSSVTTKTLRYYDEISLLRPAHVNIDNGYRFYSDDQLKDIIFINKLKDYGFSLDAIKEIMKNNDHDFFIGQLRERQSAISEQVRQLDITLSRLIRDINNLSRGRTIMTAINELTVTVVETPQRILFSKREIISLESFGLRLTELFSEAMRQGLTFNGPPLTIYYDEEFNPEAMDVELAVPVQHQNEGTRVMPGHLCAMVRLKGPYSDMPIAYAALNNWLIKSEYELCSPPYEVYITDPMRTAPEDYITEVYFPVRKK